MQGLSLHACVSGSWSLTLSVWSHLKVLFLLQSLYFVPENWAWQPPFLFSGCSNFKNIRDPSCSNFIFYWLESPGIICLHCILPKKDSWKKDRLNYETADVPPEVTAHGGNSSLSFQHQHLSGRSKSFLRLNIKWRQWCQGESNQWSIFGLQETRASRLLSKTDFQPVLWETFNYNEATVLKAI